MFKDRISIDEKTRTVSRITTYDAVPLMTEAHFEKINGNNGFSKGRTQRVIGEIPLAEYLEMQRVANERDEPLTGTQLKEFLRQNPGYMTVNGLDTGASGKIIIK
ncbi:hypothetical protein [Desulfovibrio gilichinskyi]|uniref:Uncharacterized protein n=1 Tax=Desulfovibrio gilichinskyi TaxID=1519643 RepID=A0A1X7C3M3_9BACT|nr:hypothetical protein [Desulfovibrio gilichinskyi]SME89409.1 hypothetical protein SAMN06295933_0295 [Desulfovibrio gilichinskyi]